MNQPVVSGSVKFTAESAPRTVEELALIGRFRLKDLAMSIGLGDVAEHRAALTSMKVEDLAQAIAQQLARLDSAAPAAAAPPAQEAPFAPPQQQEPAQEAPKRSPRTPRVQPPQAEGSTVVVDLGPVLAQLSALQEQVANLSKQLVQMESIQANVAAEAQFQARLNTSLSLFFAEEQLGGSRPEILAAAFLDMPGINEMIVTATSGKANKGGK
jgi:hypothetical protein